MHTQTAVELTDKAIELKGSQLTAMSLLLPMDRGQHPM